MAVNQEKTLAWLKELSEQAFAEARTGNPTLANKMGKIPAFAYYFQNVHAIKSVSPEQFARQYPQYVIEADRARVEYEALEAAVDTNSRVGKIEAELTALRDELREAVKTITESAKSKGKQKPVIEAETPAETPAPETVEKPAAEPDKDAEADTEADAESEA